jgi:hypothetical protein
MTTQLKHLIAPLLLAGILGGVSIQPAVAGPRSIDGDTRCTVDMNRRGIGGKQQYEFLVTSPNDEGAVGVWRNRRDLRIVVKVDPGEQTATEQQFLRRGIDLTLTRCETL